MSTADQMAHFRKLKKENPGGMLPRQMVRRLRSEAYRGRTSVTAIMTKYMAIGMGYDLAEFGLDHMASETSPAA